MDREIYKRGIVWDHKKISIMIEAGKEIGEITTIKGKYSREME